MIFSLQHLIKYHTEPLVVPANLNLLIRIALKATIILTFPKYTPVMLVQG